MNFKNYYHFKESEEKNFPHKNLSQEKILQKQVEDQAKSRGYTIGPVWHGTPLKHFYHFSFEKTEGRGFWFAKNRDYAASYAQGENARIFKVYLQVFNLLPIEKFWRFGTEEGLSKKEAIEKCKQKGFDGIQGSREFIVFYPHQIKLADPITYDDKGLEIPLSQRFNPSSNDIRY